MFKQLLVRSNRMLLSPELPERVPPNWPPTVAIVGREIWVHILYPSTLAIQPLYWEPGLVTFQSSPTTQRFTRTQSETLQCKGSLRTFFRGWLSGPEMFPVQRPTHLFPKLTTKGWIPADFPYTHQKWVQHSETPFVLEPQIENT